MGKVWCDGFPLVVARQASEPKPVTFIHPYYRNPRFLGVQISWWSTFPEWLRAHLTAIIVDDGSPEPASEVLRNVRHPFPIRLFRIQEDRRWNWLAARNIGFRHAPEGWCLVTDIDHVIPQTTANAVVYGEHDPNVIYGFSRREYTGVMVPPHPNSWLMTRKMFWRVGGYDEALSGYYGTDGDWRRRMAAVAPIHILSDRLIRHEYQQDSSTTAYLRKQPVDAAVKAIIAKRDKGWRPKTLSFPYEEVSLVKEAACL
jgi:glycosyl transferase family 2